MAPELDSFRDSKDPDFPVICENGKLIWTRCANDRNGPAAQQGEGTDPGYSAVRHFADSAFIVCGQHQRSV